MFERRPALATVRCASALLLVVSGCCFEIPGKPGTCVPWSSGGASDGDTTAASTSTTGNPSTASATITNTTDPTESSQGSMSASMSGTGTGTDSEESGSTNASDITGSTTSVELCGNGVVDPGEACDQDKNRGGDNGCKPDCSGYIPYCGDGKLDMEEACDDGNHIDTDACVITCSDLSNVTTCTCTAAYCGDGKVQAGEVCDDGNGDEYDGCPNTCKGDRHLVFVTNGAWSGNLTENNYVGLAGADRKCQTEAEGSGLTGEYKAWLSTKQSPVTMRLAPLLNTDKPFVLRNTSTIAGNWADLTDSQLTSVIDRGPNKEVISASVWTQTAADGVMLFGPVEACSNWQATQIGDSVLFGGAGTTELSTKHWTANVALPCTESYHLYCFQVSYVTPPP